LRDVGASLAITYLDEKAKPYAEPLAGALGAELFLPLDVREAPQMTALFAAIREKWGRLDFLVHSLAFAPKADSQGRLVDSSVEGPHNCGEEFTPRQGPCPSWNDDPSCFVRQ
jgi:enoyl-[acyl-carrier protein] reductase I